MCECGCCVHFAVAEGIQYTSKKDTPHVLLCVGLHVFVHFWRLSGAVWSSCQPIAVLALQRAVAVVEFSFTSETIFLPIPTTEHTGKKLSSFSVNTLLSSPPPPPPPPSLSPPAGESSRVRLRHGPQRGSDYINASFINVRMKI